MSDTQNNNTNVNEIRTPIEFQGEHHSHIGPILGVLVIMLILILGGLYLWGGVLEREMQTPIETPLINNEPETPRAEADQQILETVSPSDDLSVIEADINATNLDSLEIDMMTIDAELDAALAQ